MCKTTAFFYSAKIGRDAVNGMQNFKEMQLMVDGIKFSKGNSDVLLMVIGGRPKCAM
jgi:hypothetical protein